MTLVMIFTSYLQNLNIHSNKMAEKAMFKSIKSGPSLLKKKTFSEKAKQWAVIKFCAGIEKTPAETHKFLKQSEKHRNVSHSLVFKGHKRFLDGMENVMDDVQEGRPSFRNYGAVKNEVRDDIDGDLRLTCVKLQKNVEFQRLRYRTFYLKI